MEPPEIIKIDYFYIEGNQLRAIEKVEGKVQGPPRMFGIEGRTEFGDNTDIEVVEINYR